MKWAEEEKAATAAWAEEQRASVAKEKRALQASRLRSQNVSENGPASRKERAEVQVSWHWYYLDLS